jgi:hypothetical protein
LALPEAAGLSISSITFPLLLLTERGTRLS